MVKNFTPSRWKASAQVCSSVGANGGPYLIITIMQHQPDLMAFHNALEELHSFNLEKIINEMILL